LEEGGNMPTYSLNVILAMFEEAMTAAGYYERMEAIRRIMDLYDYEVREVKEMKEAQK
jgi:hypothetical protein